MLLAALGYLAFVVRQRRARSPLMDVKLLARRPVATGTFLILIATALMIAVFFLGTFYFQHALGYGALQTGLLFRRLRWRQCSAPTSPGGPSPGWGPAGSPWSVCSPPQAGWPCPPCRCTPQL
jgi:hypothetical protein